MVAAVKVDGDGVAEAAAEAGDDGAFGVAVEAGGGDEIHVEFVERPLGDAELTDAVNLTEHVDQGQGVHATDLVAGAADDLIGEAAADFG